MSELSQMLALAVAFATVWMIGVRCGKDWAECHDAELERWRSDLQAEVRRGELHVIDEGAQ